ncbi:hypothetical protein BDZ89DRAFT_1071240, partial [Hymenopellis radicata]
TGESLLRSLENAFAYTTPQRVDTASTSAAPYQPPLPPSLDRLPAFIIHVNDLDKRLLTSLADTLNSDLATGTIDYSAVIARCSIQLSENSTAKMKTKGDVCGMASFIVYTVKQFVDAIYRRDVDLEEQHHLPVVYQTPDRLVSIDGSRCVVWEDNSWRVFAHSTPEIVELADSDAGKRLKRETKEEHSGRAMLCKIATAMFDCDLYWGLLFGGDGAILFQRCASREPTRMLLVPGNKPLVDVAKWKIPVPTACPPNPRISPHNTIAEVDEDVAHACEQNIKMMSGAAVRSMIIQTNQNIDICFSMPGFEFTTIRMSSSSTIHMSLGSAPDSPPLLTPPHETTPLGVIHKGLEEHFANTFRSPTGLSTTSTSTPRHCLHMNAYAIAPGYQGKSDLQHEAHVYNILASLQGRVLPQMVGLFEGEGWIMLIAEHCGNQVTDISELSFSQREMLWRYACEIHAKDVRHADLDLRNLVVSASGDVYIVDFAFSEVGHECEVGTCEELSDFRKLLELA